MRHMRAHLTDITGRIILRAGYLLAQDRGSMASTAEGTADGAVTTVAATDVATMKEGAATTAAVDIVAKADGMAAVYSAGTRASTAAEDSMAVAASREVTHFMVVAVASTVAVGAGSTEAVTAEVSTAVVVSMVAVGPMEEVDPTAGATDSCYTVLLSHLNGWQPRLPAVLLCCWCYLGRSQDRCQVIKVLL